MGTLSGEATLPFSFFASFPNRGQLLKAKICSYRSKFFPLKVDPISERFSPPQNQERKSQKLSVLAKMAEIMVVHVYP